MEEAGGFKGNGTTPSYGRRRRVWPMVSRGREAARFRVRYEKQGDARFTSHLDLVRVFDRALRVAKIPMAYTQGFNRHAKIAYGPPLSLGATSEAEHFDLDLARPCSWETIAAMNEVLPEGLRLLEGRPFDRSPESLMAAVTRADFTVWLTDYLIDRIAGSSGADGIRAELESSLLRFQAAHEWPLAKPGHGSRARTVNARPAVASIVPLEAGGSVGVRIEARLQTSGYTRPELLLRSLLSSFEFDPRLIRSHREAMWVERGGRCVNPLDALEESAFWRPVPVDRLGVAPPDPGMEVNASRNHH